MAVNLAVPIALGRVSVRVADQEPERHLARSPLPARRRPGPAGGRLLRRQGARGGSAREGRRGLLLPPGFVDAAARAFVGGPPRSTLGSLLDPSRQAEAVLVRGLVTEPAMETVTARPFDPSNAAMRPTSPCRTSRRATSTRETGRRSPASSPADYFGRPAAERAVRALPRRRWWRAGRSLRWLGARLRRHGGAVRALHGLEAGLALLGERRRGVWDRLRAAPLSLATLLGARTSSSIPLALLAQRAGFGFGAAAFGVRVSGSRGLRGGGHGRHGPSARCSPPRAATVEATRPRHLRHAPHDQAGRTPGSRPSSSRPGAAGHPGRRPLLHHQGAGGRDRPPVHPLGHGRARRHDLARPRLRCRGRASRRPGRLHRPLRAIAWARFRWERGQAGRRTRGPWRCTAGPPRLTSGSFRAEAARRG